MKIGQYDITTVQSGKFRLDGGAMFGVVPKVLWERKIPSDELNRINMYTRCLLIRAEISGRKRVILVDTGMGDKWDKKTRDIYAVDNSEWSLTSELKKKGVAPEDVTDVIITHFHFDHVGGAAKFQGDKIVPTFPKATYYIQKDHLEWAQHPSAKDRVSFMSHDFEPLLAAKQLETLNGPVEFLPNFNLRVTQGHTIAMQHPIIADDKTTFFYGADLIPTYAHVAVPWIMGFDVRPLVTIEEKNAILAEAEKNKWIVGFGHCTKFGACKIIKTEKGYAIGETFEL